jgi:hypothetical protein
MYCPYLQLPLDDPIFGNGVRVLAARPQVHAAVWVRRFRPGPPRRRKRPDPAGITQQTFANPLPVI